jgi:hypothetical protein
MRPSTVLFHVTKRLLYTRWRDPGEEPKLHLFGQLKRITKEWIDTCLICKGGTYPAQLIYQELADIACERITAGITRALVGERPIKALLDAYNPSGSSKHVNFNTSKRDRWETDARRCHINWIILDSDWEGEFCRVAEAHPKVRAYVKNHNFGLEVPYRYGSETRRYVPDFVVLVDDGHGDEDLLHLLVEIKGYRREDAKEKKATMENYWVPGVNNLGTYGRWAFAEFTEVYQIEADFQAKVEFHFNQLINSVTKGLIDPSNTDAKRAETYILQQLGTDAKWMRLNSAIWRKIQSAQNHTLHLSDVDAIATSVSCDKYEVLAVLALLSRQSLHLLRIQFRSVTQGGVEITQTEFVGKLTDWWKHKSIPESAWKEWASNTQVGWVSASETMGSK